MARGFAVPFAVNARGRAEITEGWLQTRKDILIALADGSSRNPWNDAGIDHPLFELPTAGMRAELERRIRVHFARFERDHRATLKSVDLAETKEGTLEVRIVYHDTNADRPVTLPISVPRR